jgi:hypothetical protein
MRRDEAFFGQQELVLLYVARRLREAKRIEALLEQAGVDYLIELDTYRGGVIFVSERVGAFFYASEAQCETARTRMREAGFHPFEAGEGQSD